MSGLFSPNYSPSETLFPTGFPNPSRLDDSMKLPSDQNGTGRDLGDEELAFLRQAIESGTLTATKGEHSKAFEGEFAEMFGVDYAMVCASGSAAVHVAVAAVNPNPGDEIITTSITDMGALTPILYQGAIPVFCDVDAVTGNVTAETIADRISDRTKAIIVTHLFGNPCDMGPIMELAAKHNLPVIEDSAQAFLSAYQGKLVGSMGDIGCFSFQQGKHMTSGEGGIVVTNNEAHAKRMRAFINKAWPYGEPNPDHRFIALNYRITELQSAVLRAQLKKLPGAVEHRIKMADQLTQAIKDVPGIICPPITEGDTHVFWRYALHVDESVIPGGPVAVAEALKEMDIPAAPRYINKPAFRCAVIAEQCTFGDSGWPFTLARPEAVDYSEELFPGSFAMLASVLVIPFNEKLTSDHVDFIADGVRRAAEATAQ